MKLRQTVSRWLLSIFLGLILATYAIAGEQEITLTKLSGRVELQTIGQVKWQRAETGLKLKANQRLRTFEKAQATLELGEGSSMIIAPETIIDVLELRKQIEAKAETTRFKVWLGRIRTEVKKLDANSRFEVITPTAVAGIRGTIWDTLVAEDESSSYYVKEGSIWLENLSGSQKYMLLEKQIANVFWDGRIELPVNATPSQQEDYEKQWQEEVEPKPEVKEVTIEPQPEVTREEAQPAPAPERAKKRLNLGGGIGSRMINGQLYNEVLLQPEFSLGRFGIGLNILARWNDDGFRKDDWKEVGNIVRYVRWAEKGAKPLYLRLGTIDKASLGHGFIVDAYSNQGTDTGKQALGSEIDINLKNCGLETLVNKVDSPRLYGARIYFQLLKMMDINIPILNKTTLGLTYASDNEPQEGNKEALTVYGGDMGLPILGNWLSLHADYAQIKDYGEGLAYGLNGSAQAKLLAFNLGYKIEMRKLEANFVPSIFNPLYEITRPGTTCLQSGKETNGWYAQARMGLIKAVIMDWAMQAVKDGNPRVHGGLTIDEQLLHRLTKQRIGISFAYDQEKKSGESLFDLNAKNSITTQQIIYGLSDKITLVYIYQWRVDKAGHKTKTSSLATRMQF